MQLVCLNLSFSFHQILSHCGIWLPLYFLNPSVASFLCLGDIPCDSSRPWLCRCYRNTMQTSIITTFLSLFFDRSSLIKKCALFGYSVLREKGLEAVKPADQSSPNTKLQCFGQADRNTRLGKFPSSTQHSPAIVYSWLPARYRHCWCRLGSVLKVSWRKVVLPLPPELLWLQEWEEQGPVRCPLQGHKAQCRRIYWDLGFHQGSGRQGDAPRVLRADRDFADQDEQIAHLCKDLSQELSLWLLLETSPPAVSGSHWDQHSFTNPCVGT